MLIGLRNPMPISTSPYQSSVPVATIVLMTHIIAKRSTQRTISGCKTLQISATASKSIPNTMTLISIRSWYLAAMRTIIKLIFTKTCILSIVLIEGISTNFRRAITPKSKITNLSTSQTRSTTLMTKNACG